MSLAEDRWVRVMADYSADGVWSKRGGACDASDLPVSPNLHARLRRWQLRYESRPLHGDWPELEEFSAEGEDIARAIKAELPDWTVVYHNEAKAEAADRERPVSLPEGASLSDLLRAYADRPRDSYEYEIHPDRPNSGAAAPLAPDEPGQTT